jgi:hypothetical protein
MPKVYVFKVALKHRKGLWRRIEILDNQTLGVFDYIIRKAFKHDLSDHLSEFYLGRAGSSIGFGEIEPGGGGIGARKRINQIGLTEGQKMEYLYDFGDNIQHIIILEKITEPEKGVGYPRIVSQSRPRYRYCETCKKEGKKIVANWICITCSEEKLRNVYICDNCAEKKHGDHYIEEIVY